MIKLNGLKFMIRIVSEKWRDFQDMILNYIFSNIIVQL